VLLSAETLATGSEGLAQLVLPSALPARHGDLFVLRDIGAGRTIGGGRVLDPSPPARRRRTPERLAILAALRTSDPAQALSRLAVTALRVVALDEFALDRGLTAGEVDTCLADLHLLQIATADGRYVMSEASAGRFGDAVTAILAPFHAANPHLPGMPEARLRLAMEPRPSRTAFEAILTALVERGIVARQASMVRLPCHTSSLGPQDLNLWAKVRPIIEAERFRPPTAREIGLAIGHPVTNVRRLCKTLARMGELMEVTTDRFFLRGAMLELGEMARALASENGEPRTFTAAEFRDSAGCGRSVAIQILEYFDRHGITLRQGDMRRLAKDPARVLAHR
jgi:selenocysteine-specific elongation factor